EFYLRDGNSPSSVKDSADKDQEDDEAVLDEATEEEHGKEEQDSNVVLVDDDDDDDDDVVDIDEGNNMNGLFEEVLENTEDRRYDDYPPNVTAVIKLDTKGSCRGFKMFVLLQCRPDIRNALFHAIHSKCPNKLHFILADRCFCEGACYSETNVTTDE
ncbi:hypothetical protein LSH36_81g01005, partial [Paralvinella palmiformis]